MRRVAIIGAGISGLFIANLFKRNPNYKITIYEKTTTTTGSSNGESTSSGGEKGTTFNKKITDVTDDFYPEKQRKKETKERIFNVLAKARRCRLKRISGETGGVYCWSLQDGKNVTLNSNTQIKLNKEIKLPTSLFKSSVTRNLRIFHLSKNTEKKENTGKREKTSKS